MGGVTLTGHRALAALVLALPAVLLASSWGRWADPVVDYGRELYTAWRLSCGDRLYVDIAWFNGPLSAYWNAAWMTLFGASMRTLVWVDFALLYVLLGLLLALLRRWASPSASLCGCLVLISAFAFGSYARVGNYNYITPYSHEIVHGLLLALAMLLALQRGAWALAGLALGLTFLTKAELFLAAGAAAAVRSGLHLASGGSWRRPLTLALAAPVPALAALALLTRSLEDVGTAWRGTLGSWAYVRDASVRELSFYSQMSGLDRPWHNLGELAVLAAGPLAALALAAAAGRRLPRRWDGSRRAHAAALAAGGALTTAVLVAIQWQDLLRPYPLYLAAVALLVGRRWRRLRDLPERASAVADQLAFVVLAGALLLKILLQVNLKAYGFVLALPATLVLVVTLVDGLPRSVARRGGGRVLRAAVMGGLLAFSGTRMLANLVTADRELPPLESRGDVLRVRWRGAALASAIEDLEQRLGPEDTLFVLPEGVMLNFLVRSRNPTPYINFMPPELLFWGEGAVIEALEAAPPDVIAVVHRDTHFDYQAPWFGTEGFGEELMSWVREHYEVQARHGHEPLQEQFQFGVELLTPRR